MIKLYLLGEPIYLYIGPFGLTSFLLGLLAASYYLSRGAISVRISSLLFVILVGVAFLPSHFLLQTNAGAISPSAHMAYMGITVASGLFLVKNWVQYIIGMKVGGRR